MTVTRVGGIGVTGGRLRATAAIAALACMLVGLVTATSARATAPAPIWTSAVTLTAAGESDPTLANDRIDVAMGSAGDAAVAWLSGVSGGTGTVAVAVRAGQADATWETHTLTATAVATSEPRVAVGGNGDAVVVWGQADGLYAAYRQAGLGRNWTAPELVHASAVSGVSVAMDPDGNSIVAWGQPKTYGYTTGDTPMVAFRPAGLTATWTAAEEIADPAGSNVDGVPHVAMDAAGNALIVFAIDAVRLGCGFYDCWGVGFADRSHDDADFGVNTFGAGRILRTFSYGDTPSLDLSVAQDGAAAVSVGYPHNDSYLFYRPSGSTTFDASVIGAGAVSTDPAGDAFVAATSADYVHPAGVGQSWTTVGTGPFVPQARYYDQYVPRDAALDASGQAVVVGAETDEVSYTDNAVAAVRGTDGSWSSVTKLNDTSEGASDQLVAADAQGDATVAWVEDVGGNDMVRVAGLVGGPTLTSLTVPGAAVQGDPTTFSVVPRDVWHAISDSDVTWTFTNESDPTDTVTDNGASVSHAFSSLGTYDVSVTATDSAGSSVTSAVKQVTVTVPDASLSADVTSGVAPLTVTLDASGSTTPPGATFTFFCGDSDRPVAPASASTTATCTYDRESPDGGWGAYVVMHDTGTGRDFQATVDVSVAPRPNTVDDSAAFDAANPDGDVTVADDGSLASNTCTSAGRTDSYCMTLDDATVVLTAAPGTFAPGTHVLVYHGDTTTLQQELGSGVQAQGGFAVTWTPRSTLSPGKPLLVSVETGSSAAQPALMRAGLIRPFDIAGFFSGLVSGVVSGATKVITTIGSAISTGANAIKAAGSALWTSFTQSITHPNGDATNNLLYCGSLQLPPVPSTLNPIVCEGGYTVVTGVPTDRIAALTAGGSVIAAGAGNVITAGGGNVITAGGGNVITAGGGNVITAGGGNVITAGGGNVISAGGGNVITAGGGNVISAGGGNLTFGLVNDPGIGFVQPTSSTPPTVTATCDPVVPGTGYYASGAVTVHLHATAADGSTVKNVSYAASGAEQILNTQVAGADADITVDQPGSTKVTYTAEDDSLSQSDPQTITVDIATPPAAPTGVTATSAGPTSATVSWQAPAPPDVGPITGYTVQVIDGGRLRDGSDAAAPVDVHFDSTDTSEVIDNLTPDHSYVFTVAADNGVTGATSDVSNPVLAGAVPDAVTGLTVTGGNDKVDLAWNVPGDGGIPLNNYFVYRSTTSGGPYTAITTKALGNLPTAPTFTDTSVSNGTTYYYVVTAENALGESAYSDEAVATPATVATAPSITTVTPGDGDATVSFDPPASDGGSAVEDYVVAADPEDGGQVVTGTASGSPYTLTGLTDGVTYDVTVVAHNGAGDSAPSAVRQVTPEVPVTPPGGGGVSGPPGLQDVASATSTSERTNAIATSSSAAGHITATGHGAGTIVVGDYDGRPTSTGPVTFQSAGSYVDVFAAAGSAFSAVDITDCDLGAGDRVLYWWDPASNSWRLVQPQHFEAGPPGCITTTIDASSVPDLAQLTGTVFAAAAPASPTVSAVSPDHLLRGATTTVTVTGTGFQSGATIELSPGGDVKVGGPVVVGADGTSVKAPVVVASDASAGPITVTVVNPDTGWGECGSCLTVASAPTVTVAHLPRVAHGLRTGVHFDAAERGGTIVGYDVRTSEARYDAGAFSRWAVASTQRRSDALAIAPGETTCVAVRARDSYGQASDWSPTQCVTRPLPVTAAVASRQWTPGGGGGRFMVAHGRGATLELRHARFDDVGLAARRCPACGRLRVQVDGTALGVINLRAHTSRADPVSFLPAPGSGSGRLLFTTLSGKTVAVRGIVLWRSRPQRSVGGARAGRLLRASVW